jgi:hypothetical protein
MKLTKFSGRLFMVIALVSTYCLMGLMLMFIDSINSETKVSIFAAIGLIVQTIARDYFNRTDRYTDNSTDTPSSDPSKHN